MFHLFKLPAHFFAALFQIRVFEGHAQMAIGKGASPKLLEKTC
jgi:hypothetical protein